jgi:Holliday junction resolvase
MREGGRLHSYFESIFRRVEESTLLERTAIAIAEGATEITQIGKALALTPGTAYTAIRRLQELDIIAKRNGAYDYADPLLKNWVLGTRTPLKGVITPLLLGNESERRVAEALAREGFRLVYQSRASRGAFDLLAIVDNLQVGLQVKSAERQSPHIPLEVLERIVYEGERLGWIPAIAIHKRKEDEVRYSLATQLLQAKRTTVDNENSEPSLLRLIRHAQPANPGKHAMHSRNGS